MTIGERPVRVLFRHKFISSTIIAATCVISTSVPSFATERTLVSIKTPSGAKQAFILIKPPKPVASVILFAGGHGRLGLQSATTMNWGRNNFLVRTREMFAAKGLMVAVVDAPSGRSKKSLKTRFRLSRAHAGNISAVVAYLKKQAAVPVWLVGTSRGTFSAANGAIRSKGVNGLVLTATMTRFKRSSKVSRRLPNAVASMALERIKAPTLIVHHRQDGCVVTPASGVKKLRRRLSQAKPMRVVMLSGGKPARSAPCKARSAHGFFGIESTAVGTITNFVLANSR